MVCIYCGNSTEVINSRHQKMSNNVWRRRKCSNCKTIFTTTESANLDKALMVSDGSAKLEPFSRDKLFMTVFDSLKHRKRALEDASSITDTIISKVLHSIQTPEVELQKIITLTLETLSSFDSLATEHYRAYYAVTY